MAAEPAQRSDRTRTSVLRYEEARIAVDCVCHGSVLLSGLAAVDYWVSTRCSTEGTHKPHRIRIRRLDFDNVKSWDS